MKRIKSAVNHVPYGTHVLKAIVTFQIIERKDGLFNIHSSEQGRCFGQHVPEVIKMLDGKNLKPNYDEQKKGYRLTEVKRR